MSGIFNFTLSCYDRKCTPPFAFTDKSVCLRYEHIELIKANGDMDLLNQLHVGMV